MSSISVAPERVDRRVRDVRARRAHGDRRHRADAIEIHVAVDVLDLIAGLATDDEGSDLLGEPSVQDLLLSLQDLARTRTRRRRRDVRHVGHRRAPRRRRRRAALRVPRCDRSRRTRRPRMGAAPEVEVAGSACGSSPIPRRPQEQQLVRGHVAVQRVPAGEPHEPLHVERRQHLTMLDQVGKLREVLGDRGDHAVGAILLDLVPRALAERGTAGSSRRSSRCACPRGRAKRRAPSGSTARRARGPRGCPAPPAPAGSPCPAMNGFSSMIPV